jgi:hypothetical protein
MSKIFAVGVILQAVTANADRAIVNAIRGSVGAGNYTYYTLQYKVLNLPSFLDGQGL